MPLGRALANTIPSYGRGYARNAAECAVPEIWRGLLLNYPFYLGSTGGIVRNLANPSGLKNPSLLGSSAVPWVQRKAGTGIFFDNSASPTSVISTQMLQDDVGYWHDAFTYRTWFFILTLEADTGGPNGWWEEGGSSIGTAMYYRTGPNTLHYGVRGLGTHEIDSGSTFLPEPDFMIYYCARFNAGELRMWINGQSEGSTLTASGSALPSHGSEPGIGGQDSPDNFGASGGAAAAGTSTTFADEWGGTLIAAYSWDAVLPETRIFDLFEDPYLPCRLKKRRVFFVPAVAGGGTGSSKLLTGVGR